MDLLFWKTCDMCKGMFKKKDMKHNILIGPHYPWSMCKECYCKPKGIKRRKTQCQNNTMQG